MKGKALLISLLIASTLQAQNVFRVTPDGNGDGTSWANASSLQNAMTLATSGDQVWVQKGVYLLDTTLVVPNGVLMYGGFLGNEDYLSQRDFARNRTIFDGVQSGYTVVRLGVGAVLNGFAVINGHAHRDDSEVKGDLGVLPFGGGVWMEVDARVENSYILDNTAGELGGGIFAEGDGLVFNTLIVGNVANDGLAIWGTTLEVRNVTASQNRHLGDLPTVDANFCNLSTPAWVILGTQRFVSDNILLTDTLLWSDTVSFSTCNKEDFNAGTAGPPPVFNVDCRSNPYGEGSLFSWCAFYRFGHILCPYPWRVPYIPQDMARGHILRCVRDCPQIYILAHPDTTSRNIVVGDTFPMLSVSATSEFDFPISFQWFSNSRPDTVGATPFFGATDSTFIPPTIIIGPPSTIFYSYYFVVVSSFCGSITSNVSGRHTVEPPPPPPPPASCNSDTPGWGPDGLGASFVTTNTWTIRGTSGRPTQEWSDAVIATACNKTAFNGGVAGSFIADCRNSAGNNNFYGHFFSWCAVVRFADELCPPAQGWRVPTTGDFAILHQNLGYAMPSTMGESVPIIANTYMGTVAGHSGGAWGGSRFTAVDNFPMSGSSSYWSSTEVDANNARKLSFGEIPNVWPQFSFNKARGLALRCVR